MKITGSSSYIKFDLENGYVLKAAGEMLVGGRFVVYKNSMKYWQPPHDDERLSKKQINDLIRQVKENNSQDTVQIIFE